MQRPQSIAYFIGLFLMQLVASIAMSPQKTIAETVNSIDSTMSLDQVTSVSQLSDVRPTDWAFQALQSLVERYGCIAGYPDKTYRGNRSMTRYEFAAGLSACVDRVNDLIAASTADAVKKEDIATIRKLQEQFAAELSGLRSRVDSLEAKQTTLQKQQFSTTTKLNGQVIMAITDAWGGASRNGQNDQYNTTLSTRVRLNLTTSFTGKDQLLVRLQATNIMDPRSTTDTAPGNDSRLSFQSGSDTSNAVAMTLLKYNGYLNPDLNFVIATGSNVSAIDLVNNIVNPLASDSQATVSRFGRFSPIYRLGGETGVALNWNISPTFSLEGAYMANQASQPNAGKGLLNGNYSILGQLVYKPKFGTFALTYVNAYGDNGLGMGTGSLASNLSGRSVSSNSYGFQANVNVTPQFQLGGWVGYTQARALTGAVRGDADIWNYAVTLGFPDLFKKGNLGGVIVGMQPKLTGTSDLLSGLSDRADRSTGYHIEAFYRHQVSPNLSITPGLIYSTAPNHNDQNRSTLVGLIRTTFTF